MEYFLTPPVPNTGAVPKNTERVLLSRNARRKNNDNNRNLSYPPINDSLLPPISIGISSATSNVDIYTSSAQVVQDNQDAGAPSLYSQGYFTLPGEQAYIPAITIPTSTVTTSSAPESIPQSSVASTLNADLQTTNMPSNSQADSQVQNIENRILSVVESRINTEFSRLNNIISQLTAQLQNIAVRDDVEWPRDNPSFSVGNRPREPDVRVRDTLSSPPHQPRSSQASSLALANSSKVANIISNWHVTFSGSPNGMPVEKFIYIINSLVNDSLNGDFALLSEHCHLLFTFTANDWFWRYRRTVPHIDWRQLCVALQRQYNDNLSDGEIRDLIMNRKQGFNESFDDFYADILRLCDRLRTPMTESDLVDTIRKCIRPHIRKELLYFDINSISHLRRLVIRREVFSSELSQATSSNKRVVHEIAEVEEEVLRDEQPIQEVVQEVRTNVSLKDDEKPEGCFNCKAIDHKYKDCIQPRTIFCYGCGKPNVYRPQCPKCGSGNGSLSNSNNNSWRSKRN